MSTIYEEENGKYYMDLCDEEKSLVIGVYGKIKQNIIEINDTVKFYEGGSVSR